MNCEKLKSYWLAEEQHSFQGWDFSHIQSRWQHEPLGWDYKSIIMEHLCPTDQLLDMGTGGGEFLLSLNHPYENTSVTEAWAPNIQLCRERLAPLGIQVYPVQEDAPLPEVKRVLKLGGLFITQQVGSENCASLEKRINLEEYARPAFSLQTELPVFQECGFAVKYAAESFPELKFFDVGAIVFWAKIIEWSFPGFSVEKNFERLCALQNELELRGFISTTEHRFLIVSQNLK